MDPQAHRIKAEADRLRSLVRLGRIMEADAVRALHRFVDALERVS